MTDVRLPSLQESENRQDPDNLPGTASDLGWPGGVGTEIGIDVSRETSMERADLGWPE